MKFVKAVSKKVFQSVAQNLSASRVLFFVLTAVLIAGCGDSDNSSSAVIGVDGGTIISSDGRLTLSVPAGALSQDVTITIEDADPSSLPDELLELVEVSHRYLLSPTGLQFAAPARIHLSLESTAVNDNSSIDLPVRFLTVSNGESSEVLGNQLFEYDLDNQSLSLAADLSHFSEVWDNLPRNGGTVVRFGGVPAEAAVRQMTFTATVSVVPQAGGSRIRADEVFVVHDDVDPIRVSGSRTPDSIVTLGAYREGQVTPLSVSVPHDCLQAGEGEYYGQVYFEQFNLFSGFATAGMFVPLDTLYGSSYKRTVTCLSAVSTPVPQPTSGASPTPVVDPTTAPAPTPTAGSATPTPAGGKAEVALNPTSLSFTHSVGSTSCPQSIGTITVTNSGELAGNFSASTSTAALRVSPQSFALEPGQSQTVAVQFTCSQSTSFNATITVTANSTGGTDTDTASVSGNVS